MKKHLKTCLAILFSIVLAMNSVSVSALALDNDNEQEMSTVENGENYEGVQGEDSEEVQAIDVENSSKSGGEAGETEETISEETGQETTKQEDAEDVITTEEIRTEETAVEETAVETTAVETTSEAITGENEEETTEEMTSEAITEESEESVNMPEFAGFKIVDGVVIMVTAPEGVFPEESTLLVNKVSNEEQQNVENAVDKTRNNNVNVAASYTYDIKVLNKDGEEIQPADEQKVKVIFTLAEADNENLTADIYHITGENGELSAEALDTTGQGAVVMAESDGFSYYTVEFTYDEKQYVMQGDSTVALTDILSFVGITKEDGSVATDSDITAVSVSDESLFSASNESEEWIVTAHQAFTSTEWMKVTVDGVLFEIIVTDQHYVGDNYTLPSQITGTSGSLVKNKLNILYYLDGNYVGKTQLATSKTGSSTNYYYYNSIKSQIEQTTWVKSDGCTYSINYYFNVENDYPYAKKEYTNSIMVPPYVVTFTAYSNNNFSYSDADGYGGGKNEYNVMTVNLSKPTYKVTYNANAGSDTVSGLSTNSVTVSQGSLTTLPNLTRIGYTFNGWYNAASGGTKAGSGGASYKPTGNITLYAQWTLKQATAPTITVTGADLTYGYTAGTVKVNVTAPTSDHIFTYQWYDRGTNASGTGTSISGATSATYTIPNGKNVGTYYYYCVVTATRSDNGQKESTTGENASVKVKKANGSGTVSMANWTYGGTASDPIPNSATNGTSNVTYKYKVKGAQDSTYSDSKPTDAGEYTVQATFASTVNYNEVTATADFTINKAAMNGISSNGYTGTYDAAGHSITVTAPDGATVKYRTTDSGDYNLGTAPTYTDVGTYTVYYQITKANYETVTGSEPVQINPKELTLAWGDDTSFTYNGSQQVPTANISGVINDDDCTVSVNGAQKDYSTSPYTATAVLDGAKKGNYKLPTENTKSFTISKKAATITANDQTVTYGTSIASDTAHVTTEGFVDGEALTAITMTPSTSDVTTDGTITPSDAVIKKGDTDVTNNYDITFNTGNLKINKKPITISGIKASNKTYDGTTAATLKYNEINWVDCGKVGDDDLSVTATGVFSDANIGTGKNVTISDLALSGTKADNYELASSGQQTSTTADISAKALTIKADSDTKVYDGTAHTKNSYSVTSGELADGDTIESVTVTGSQKYAGSSDNIPSAAVIKNSSGVDVTSNYNITYTNGTLTVTKKPLTIKADSDTKVYDTTPLTKNSYTNTELAAGDTIESVTVTGSQTSVGESANVPSAAVIKNGDENVIANYDITYVNGTLEVTKKAVTITADSDTKIYDGTPLTNDGYTVSGLEAGDRVYSVTITGTQTIAGESDNVPSSAVIKNANGDVVTANYEIEYVNGTLEVTKKAVTITADSDTKVYDGTALVKDGYSITGGKLATGDRVVSVSITGSKITAGAGANVPSAAVIKNANGEAVTASYDITYENGTLEVTKKEVTITAGSDRKVYDKTPLTKDSYTYSELATGDNIESVTIAGSQTNAGESANVPSVAVIKNVNGDDVTESYDITYVNGRLEVTQKPITISGINTINKIYDGDSDVPLDYSDIDWSACGMEDGDELTVTAKGTLDDEGVGNDKNVQISDIVLGGDSVNNYILSDNRQQTSATVNVDKKTVTVTALKQTVAVNGEIENSVDMAELTGAVEGHKLAEITLTSGSTEKTTTEGVITPSEAKIVDGDIDVTDNYDITYIDGVMTVTKAEAEVVLDNGDDEAPASVTAVEVPNLLELADEEAEEGKLVKVELSVKPVSESNVNSATVADVKKTVESLFAFVDMESVKVEYLEIDLTKYVDNVKDSAISDTGTPLEIILTYDTSKAGNPVIIRKHEGTVKVFTQLSSRASGSLTDATYYVEGDKIYMYSQYFSDFAIAYSVDKTFNVNLDDGNGNVTRQIVSEGAKFIPPADLAKDGYDFGGWYKDEAFTQKWNPDTDKVTSDIKLYAKWTKKAEPSKSDIPETKADTPETKVDTPKVATTPTNTAKSPATGDAMHKDIAFFLMIFAALGIICIRFIRKRIQDR